MNKRRVLLINPNLLPYEFSFQRFMTESEYPLGLSALATFIQGKGYPVRIVDAFAGRLTLPEVRKIIKAYDPGVVGIASPVHTELGKDIFAACKGISRAIVTVLGGLAPSFMPQEIMAHIPELDYIVRGEGEIPLWHLLESLEGKKDASSIKGLVYRASDGNVAINAGRERLEDLDAIPFARDDLFIAKKTGGYRAQRRIAVEASRGCSYACAFCVINEHFGPGVRYRSVKRIVDEMEYRAEKEGVRVFNFKDSTFTSSFAYTDAFLEELMKRKFRKKIRFNISTRVDCVDAPLLKRLKNAQCDNIVYGVEAGSQKVLNSYKKRIDKERIVRAFSLTRNAKLRTKAFLIFNQYETADRGEIQKEMREITVFLKSLKPDMLSFPPLVIYPHSPLYDEILMRGAIDRTGYRQIFVKKHIPSLYISKEEIERLILRVYAELFWTKKVREMLHFARS